MAAAVFKDLCIDTGPSETLGRFWAAALGLEFEPDGGAGSLHGARPNQRVWMNVVPEPRTVKNRFHFDVHAGSIEELERLGALVIEPADAIPGRRWSVLADPEGGEFCAFIRPPDRLPDYRLYEVNLDCVDPQATAEWWAAAFGGRAETEPGKGFWWLQGVDGLPFEDWVFVAVPEPKAAKNRIHWDVTVDRVEDLLDLGATTLAEPAPDHDWSVLADPEGNEFCAFTR